MRGVLVLVVLIAVLSLLWRCADGDKDGTWLSAIKYDLAKRRCDLNFKFLDPCPYKRSRFSHSILFKLSLKTPGKTSVNVY